ncbi:aminoglycoside phosphotransferase family protein [Streptomyces sp. NPDC005969]|uniref:phosphotransferase family protein n=1 Tax=Streptomyces sp. NPDC005969 TaxID=3156722 RepID=UPI0033DA8AD7
MTTAVVRALGALAHDAAHPHRRTTAPCPTCPAPAVLADRADGTVVRSGSVVAKAHAPDTDTAALAARTALASAPALSGILLPPVPQPAVPVVDGRPVTLWPHGEPVDPAEPDAAPWEESGVLLALLHRTAPPPALPPMRGPAKAALAVARMCAARPGDLATAPVREAWRRLPDWARDEAPAPAHRSRFICHGDLHLGQLVRHPAAQGRWLLIDVDDVGLGDPAWDLARPAAWYAAGLLPPEVWLRFLEAYRAAGGPAVRADGDPWPELDVPARALTVQAAALAFAKSAAEGRYPDEVEQTMIDACARIASIPAELVTERSS